MPKFEDYGVRGGVWSGRLTATRRPGRVCATHLGEVVAEAVLTDAAGNAWNLRIDLPAALISEGVTSLILVADEAGPGAPVSPASVHLARLNLAAGRVLDDDVAAELALLRSELELLKREFRRFAAEA